MTSSLAATAGPEEAPAAISYDQAVKGFLDYLTHYRGYSPLTVRAYATDLRMLREFLENRLGGCRGRPRSPGSRSCSSG
jgi:hypothetical protein